MWLWDRLTGGRGQRGETGEPTSAPTPSTVAPERAWRGLPPIQRRIADLQPIVRVDQFSGSLRTWQSPALLGELGHGVNPEAPGGLVAGLVEPTRWGHYPAGPALTLASVPAAARRPSPVQRLASETAGSEPVAGQLNSGERFAEPAPFIEPELTEVSP